MASTYGDEETRKFALHYLPKVARTGSHLQMFVDYITSMRGWGRGLRRAVAEWYTEKDINVAVYQSEIPAALQLDPPGFAQEGAPKGGKLGV